MLRSSKEVRVELIFYRVLILTYGRVLKGVYGSLGKRAYTELSGGTQQKTKKHRRLTVFGRRTSSPMREKHVPPCVLCMNKERIMDLPWKSKSAYTATFR